MNVGNFAALLDEQARQRPNAWALIMAGKGRDEFGHPRWDRMSYRELVARSDAAAWGLREVAGLKAGDRVSVLIKPSFEFFVVVFSLLKLGAVPVFIDPGMGREGFFRCVREIQPAGLLTIPAGQIISRVFSKHFTSVRSRVTVGGSAGFWGGVSLADCEAGGRGHFPAATMDPDAQAAIFYTSGSTGPAKGVRFSHRMFNAQTRLIQQMYGLTAGETDVSCFLPFALFSVVTGQTSVLPDMDFSRPATASAKLVVRAVKTHGARQLVGSPSVMVRIARYCLERGERLPTLHRVMTFGAPIPPRVHEQYRQLLPEGAQVHTPYGATEALPIATLGTEAILAHTAARTLEGAGTCVGKPIDEIDLRILPISDEPVKGWGDSTGLPAGQVGEVAVTGQQVSRVYEQRPDATEASKIPDGDRVWHRMGDLGYIDDDGLLWFCGRKSHRVVTADGQLILPVQLEGVFNAVQGVFRSAVVGVGGAPVLVIEAEKDADQEALRSELLQLAQRHAVTSGVTRVLFHPSFPVDRRHNAKIHRLQLAEWAATR